MYNEIISKFVSKRSNLVFLASALASIASLWVYDIWNIIFYAIVTFLTLNYFWTADANRRTIISAIIWTPLTLYLLFKGLGIIGILGLPGVVAYWFYLWNGNLNPSTNTIQNPTHSTDNLSNSVKSTPTIIRVHARIPVLRIPLPWITYTLNLKTCTCITRSSWFGKMDPELFSGIKNWYISGDAIRFLTGTSSFGFQSTKPHSDDYTEWYGLPRKFAETLNRALEEKKSGKSDK